jgi:sugar lactone lactonase YvrE
MTIFDSRSSEKRSFSLPSFPSLPSLPSLLAIVAAATVTTGCTSAGTTAPDLDAATTDAPTSDGATNGPDSTAPGVDGATTDATPAPTDATPAPTDAGTDAPLAIPVFLAQTSVLTEGLWEVSPSAVEGVGTNGVPVVSSVLAGQYLAVAADGGVSPMGSAPTDGGASAVYTLGLTTDTTGNVYMAVAGAGASPVPAPGIYRFPPAGGVGTVFSLGSAATPNMNFANGLDFIGPNLFVADSEGVIYELDPNGVAKVWSSDPLLAPNPAASGKSPACGFVPLAIGANGIAHDANNVYVTNTDYGRLIRIPIAPDGSAGKATLIKEDCAALAGADGLVIDHDGSFVIALNAQNEIVRVTPAGDVTVVASGAPLATPGSVLIDDNGAGGARRLLVTNTMFFSPQDAGLSAGLLALPLP